MSYVNTELIVLMSVHAVVSAEVLRGIVVLTKGRQTRLSVQFYAFWFSAVVGYFVTVYVEMTYPAVGSNYAWRVFCIPWYPVMYCCYYLVAMSRVRVLDLRKCIQDKHLRIMTACAKLLTDGQRFYGALIRGGLLRGSLVTAVPIITVTIIYFLIANVAVYAVTLYLLRTTPGSSHHKIKIMVAVALCLTADLLILSAAIVTGAGAGHLTEAVSHQIKMRIELEVWGDFLSVVGRRIDVTTDNKSATTTSKPSTSPRPLVRASDAASGDAQKPSASHN
ncbi:hypothetical protein RI367_003374 [Sorochytrium milnesiophthora]